METNTTDRAKESRRDQLIRRGHLEDPRLSYVRWAEEQLGDGKNAIRMGAACERLCYALKAFEAETVEITGGGGGFLASAAIVKYFGPHYAGDVVVRNIASEVRRRGYDGKFSVDEDEAA